MKPLSPCAVWSKSTPPAPDNGTSAWGEPNETSPGWGEVDDPGASTTGWGNAPSTAPNAMKSSEYGPDTSFFAIALEMFVFGLLI